jgi:uncharacterized protein (TIGR00251 family)
MNASADPPFSPIPLRRDRQGRVTFAVRLVPRARRTGADGTRGEALLVRVAAPPVDGAANTALIGWLASIFDCPMRSLEIVSGETSRDKRIAVAMSEERVAGALARAIAP